MIEDHRLAYALIHEANLRLERCSGPKSRERESNRDEQSVRLAERLLSGEGTRDDRRTAREALDPGTLRLFSIGAKRES